MIVSDVLEASACHISTVSIEASVTCSLQELNAHYWELF